MTFLCLRRGVSLPCVACFALSNFSLPTQRCFYRDIGELIPYALFSAYAEVFPTLMTCTTPRSTFLCLRRGVSQYGKSQKEIAAFSLPTQRCFLHDSEMLCLHKLFSAYAEVFPPRDLTVVELVAFLCLRRGVSRASAAGNRRRAFSLPTQRCFYLQLPYLQAQELFSAYAEVFLRHSISRSPHQAFLCLRRGVSMSKGSLILTLVLFSAYAEVFLIPERDR